MGAGQSSAVPGGGTDGYHVLKVSARVLQHMLCSNAVTVCLVSLCQENTVFTSVYNVHHFLLSVCLLPRHDDNNTFRTILMHCCTERYINTFVVTQSVWFKLVLREMQSILGMYVAELLVYVRMYMIPQLCITRIS